MAESESNGKQVLLNGDLDRLLRRIEELTNLYSETTEDETTEDFEKDEVILAEVEALKTRVVAMLVPYLNRMANLGMCMAELCLENQPRVCFDVLGWDSCGEFLTTDLEGGNSWIAEKTPDGRTLIISPRGTREC
jgi:hypothetical protein